MANRFTVKKFTGSMRGSRAVRMGKWKAVALLAQGYWELYDMDHDRTEMHNLAAQYPERLKELVHAWNAWAERNHAVPWPWKPQYGLGS
jgi:arylsulfatase A-like enzyme